MNAHNSGKLWVKMHRDILVFNENHCKQLINWDVWTTEVTLRVSTQLRSSSPWGSRGTRVLNEPQLSAQPCRQSTGRPWSGPHTVPRISPLGTSTRRSYSRQTRLTVSAALFLSGVFDAVFKRNSKLTWNHHDNSCGSGCQLALLFLAAWQLNIVSAYSIATAN